MRNPISPKVISAASGAGAGSVLSGLILWAIGVWFYDVPATAASAELAIDAVPGPVSAAVLTVLVVVGAAIPGYQVPDPQRDVAANTNVAAYLTPAGLVVAGEAAPIPTGTPVDVTVNPEVGVADVQEFAHDDL